MGEQGKQPISQLDPSMWVDRHGDGLYGYALARLRDPEAAEEVVQETFVSALRAVAQYSGKGAEGAWLLGILKRKIVDHVRRRSRFDAAVGGEAEADPSEVFCQQGDLSGIGDFYVEFMGAAAPGAAPVDALYAVALRCLRKPTMMLRCREISKLVSESMERKLSLREWLELRMHLALCGLCNGFAKQVRLLHEAARRHGQQFADNRAAGEIKLSPEARARIQTALRDHMA